MGEPVNYAKLPVPLKLKHLEELVDRLFCAMGEGLRKGGFIKRSDKGERAMGLHWSMDVKDAMLPTWEEISHERNDLYKKFYAGVVEENKADLAIPQNRGPDLGF